MAGFSATSTTFVSDISPVLVQRTYTSPHTCKHLLPLYSSAVSHLQHILGVWSSSDFEALSETFTCIFDINLFLEATYGLRATGT